MANCFTAVTDECILNSILRLFASFIHTQLLRVFSWRFGCPEVYRRVIHRVYFIRTTECPKRNGIRTKCAIHFISCFAIRNQFYAADYSLENAALATHTHQWSCVVRSPLNRFLVTHTISRYGLSFTLLFDTDLFHMWIRLFVRVERTRRDLSFYDERIMLAVIFV